MLQYHLQITIKALLTHTQISLNMTKLDTHRNSSVAFSIRKKNSRQFLLKRDVVPSQFRHALIFDDAIFLPMRHFFICSCTP